MKNPGPCGPGFLLILLHYTVSLVEGDAKFAAVEDGFLNARTPKLDFRRGFCDFCLEEESMRCVAPAFHQ